VVWYRREYLLAKQGTGRPCKCRQNQDPCPCCGGELTMLDLSGSKGQGDRDECREHREKRKRLRELGVSIGVFAPGSNNAITDVAGVSVGHTTLVEGEGALVPGKGPVRTGVTAIMPHGGDIWKERVSAACYVLNGNGVVTGTDWIAESGL